MLPKNLRGGATAPPEDHTEAAPGLFFWDGMVLHEHYQDRGDLEREQRRQDVSGPEVDADQPFIAKRAYGGSLTNGQAAAGAVRHHRNHRLELFEQSGRQA
jgi:hypothetical protein